MKLLVILGLLGFASARSYRGDQVVRMFPQIEQHFEWLERLEDHRGLVQLMKPMTVKGLRTPIAVDIRIPRINLERVRSILDHSKIDHMVTIEDLQTVIDNQFDSPTRQTKQGDEYDYSEYHTYDEIVQWAQDMAIRYPAIVKLDNLTDSSEKRFTPVITIQSTNTTSPSRKVLVSCGQQAREWISPAVCQCVVGQLATKYGYDDSITEMVERITWVIVPLLNPDGYNYSWAEDRNWVKTRSVYREDRCEGTNVDTNFDVDYGGPGTSTNSCDDIYRGPRAESEPEVYALAELMRNQSFDQYITFHSYGQQILYPHFYTQKATDNQKNMQYVGLKASEAILGQNQRFYEVAPGYAAGPLKAGRAVDYAYAKTNIALSYQIELPDTGYYGYFLPESEIGSVCAESFAALEAFAKEMFPNP